jgi:trimeric autotransporter adhesin
MALLRAAIVALLLSFGATLSAATFTVSSSSDSGPGTLRQAILDANANPGLDQIRFAVQQVAIDFMPTITDPVDIDGTLPGGERVDIGPSAGLLDASLFRFSPGSGGSRLMSVGTRNYTNSVAVLEGANSVTIANNLFSGNLSIAGNETTIEQNTFALLVAFWRITITGNDTIVRGNEFLGRVFVGGTATGTVIEGNTLIGNNLLTGVTVDHSPAGAGPTQIVGNSISGHATGVAVDTTSTGVEIAGNRIFDTNIAIDLGIDGPTANDPAPDADLGANRLQNHPVLSGAILRPSSVTVTGTLTSAPLTLYTIEIFGDTAAGGDARYVLGSFEVTTDASGSAAFTRTMPVVSPADVQTISATATNRTTGETSELSAAATAVAAADEPGVPALSTWGLIAMAIALAAVTLIRIGR